MALNILENFPIKEMAHNSADYIHITCEALKLSVSDGQWYCADPAVFPVPTEDLISKVYAARQTNRLNLQRASETNNHGTPFTTGSDTVYFTVVDAHGNACSFINSNYQNFGTGLVPEGCGFTLQNRGKNFSLSPGHPNCLSPGKRPFHTIIPALATTADTEDLLCAFGVMGGFMQPQGHVQVLLNMAEFGMNPQMAVDAPRFYLEYNNKDQKWHLYLEEGIAMDVVEDLKMLLPAFVFIFLEQEDCCGCCGNATCGKSCAMLGSVVAALIGIAGAGYCLIISALALERGPRCETSSGWSYPFENTNGNYLTDHSTWSQCIQPNNVVVWNVTLFSILLGLSGIQIILCIIQVINGIIGGLCGSCCCQQKSQTYQC